MTETPVGRLVARLAAPTVASMLVTNLYNAGDAWFVSRLGTSASGAVGIVFALMAVFMALGFLFGHGAGSNISRRLGAGDVAGARFRLDELLSLPGGRAGRRGCRAFRLLVAEP